IRCVLSGDRYQSCWNFGSSEQSASRHSHLEKRLAIARRHEMKLSKRNRCLWMTAAMLLLCSLTVFAQAPAAPAPAAPSAQTPAPTPAQAAPAPAASATTPAMDAPLDTKVASPPSADEMAKGDPGGTKTGNVSDVVAADSKKGLTLADVVNQ